MRKPRQSKAYTIIELLMVILIIGILISLATYLFASVTARSHDDVRKSDLAGLSDNLQSYYLDWRSYPQFDTLGSSTATPIYDAAWQLGNANTTCAHQTTNFLTPRYVAQIPEDPSQNQTLSNQSCSALRQNQTNRYLYITNTDSNGPVSGPTMFGLMTNLAYPGSSQLSNANNPLIYQNTGTSFGPWFAGFNNYSSNNAGLSSSGIYMVIGQNGR